MLLSTSQIVSPDDHNINKLTPKHCWHQQFVHIFLWVPCDCNVMFLLWFHIPKGCQCQFSFWIPFYITIITLCFIGKSGNIDRILYPYSLGERQNMYVLYTTSFCLYLVWQKARRNLYININVFDFNLNFSILITSPYWCTLVLKRWYILINLIADCCMCRCATFYVIYI